MSTPENGRASKHNVTEIDGLEVIAREPAMGTHPRWTDRQTYFAGVEKVLLSDGTERWVCLGTVNHPCTFYSPDGTRSVVAHRNSTHNLRQPRRLTMYSDQAVRAIVTEVEKARRAGIKGYAEAAASALNAAGVKTIHGEPWTSGAVSNIYNRCKGMVKIRLPKGAKRQSVAAVITATPTGVPVTQIPDDIEQVRRLLRVWAQDLTNVQGAILRVLNTPVTVAADPDPELVEKAKKYDDLQKLLGR